MDHQIGKELLERYLNGSATAKEIIIVENWYSNKVRNGFDNNRTADYAEVKRQMSSKLGLVEVNPQLINTRVVNSNWLKYGAIAAVLVVTTTIVFYFGNYSEDRRLGQQEFLDVKPGTSIATLTLSDGTKIKLSQSPNGELAREQGAVISKSAAGQLTYRAVNQEKTYVFNNIETPRGGEYKVALPDGTLVTLNASSKLSFPTTFSGSKTRNVELNGEAYFEVAKNKNQPFLVKTRNQTIEVLGTHFNVNSYDEESFTRTTLIEGGVRITSADGRQVKLSPGQQANVGAGVVKVANVDVDNDIAWKNGDFVFNGQSLESIMRMVSRWYDVDITYKTKPSSTNGFEGQVKRTRTLKAVLKMLEETGDFKFHLEGKEVIVSK